MTINGTSHRQGARSFALFLLAQFLLLATFVLTSPPVRAAATGSTITVEWADDSGGSVPANCPGQWCRLRDAVAKAAPGDTIIFHPVVFSVPVTITLLVSNITIDKDLTIDGSTAPVTPTISGPGANCNPTPPPPTGTNCYRVFYVNAANVTLNRLRIVNGRVVRTQGGGIFNAGTLTVTNSTFFNNITSADYGSGGAIYSSILGRLTVTNSTFSNNGATTGGAINAGGLLTVTNSTITNNSSTSSGGALYSLAQLMVSNTVFAGNAVNGPGGGLYYNNSSTPVTATVMNSTFIDNTATGGGGGIYQTNGTLMVMNSTLSGNNGTTYGGAILNASAGNLTLLNSSLSGNSATNGGAIRSGAGVTTTVKNSIVANSTLGGNCHGIALAAGSTNNMSDDTTCGSSFTQSSALLLGTLGNYGGSTDTIPLLPNSPAIDAGDAAACPATDQRGITRPSTACDIGAFESQGFTFQSLTGSPQTGRVKTSFAAPLGLAVVPTSTLEPVDGGQVVFTAPSGSGVASIAPSTVTATISAGHVSQAVTANAIGGGPYNVVASARGAASVYFVLTNEAKVFLPFLKR